MTKSFLLLFVAMLAAYPIVAQDCSTLALSVTSKSNFNGFNTSCHGTSDGSFTVAASGGTGPYFFSIDGGFENLSGVFTGLPSGSYTASVRDANNCEKQILVILTPPTVLTGIVNVISNYNGQDLSCAASSDGSILVTAVGGVSPYTFSLIELPGNVTGMFSGIFTSLSAGTYSIKITDTNGCNVTTIAVTIDNPPLLMVISAITSNYNGHPISCFGAVDAVLTVTAAGGTGGYFYSLLEAPLNTSGALSGVFTGLAAGGYTVLVRDVNNCSAVSNAVVISQPSAIAGTVSGTSASCSQGKGTLTVNASGGTAPYTYVLNQIPANISGMTTGVFSNLAAGIYTVTIRDVNNCLSTTAPYTIFESSPISIETSTSEGLPGNCTDAEISVVASGGTGPYVYELNGTQSSSGVFGGLSNGSYVVSVTDANNCEKETSAIVISQASPITASAVVSSNYNGFSISCFGNSNGAITIAATGDTGYSYQSIEFPGNTTGAVTGAFTGLGAGSHTFRVTGQNGCEKVTLPIVITSPQAVTVDGEISSDYHGAQLSCFNAADGKITLTAQGGTGSYSYSIVDLSSNTTGAISGMFTGLAAGTYVLSARDLNACEAVTTAISLTPPNELIIQGEVTPDQNGDDGGILLSVTGGTTPYSFSWSNESTQQNLTNVAAGEYAVEVLDANACSVMESFVVPMIVGVEDQQNEHDVSLGFDTALQGFYLSYALAASANVSVKIFDANGKLGAKLYARQYAGEQRQVLSKQMLQCGLYIVHLSIDEKLYVRKFIMR